MIERWIQVILVSLSVRSDVEANAQMEWLHGRSTSEGFGLLAAPRNQGKSIFISQNPREFKVNWMVEVGICRSLT
jgi:hypothetical protein